ncbi:uncharacterized protein PG998_011158 [Apiospora kogelbergensis]|uniref:uncharacterized protein n=1 Tax=Apiospora kogelbergensis TaxID=1337665 RepID=UPI00312FC837
MPAYVPLIDDKHLAAAVLLLRARHGPAHMEKLVVQLGPACGQDVPNLAKHTTIPTLFAISGRIKKRR